MMARTAWLVCALLVGGCAAERLDLDRAHTRGLDRADAYVGSIDLDRARDRPPAAINGEPVTWAELAPLLAEAAGGEVLREIALDRALNMECARRGLDPAVLADPAAIARERELLAQTLQGEGVTANPDDSARLLMRLRQARGLGEERFGRLLRRSAILRALVRDEVVISEDALRTMYDLRHGPVRRVRIVVTSTLAEARAALVRINHGEDFSRIAAEISIDPSARTGGVIAPLSRSDPTWPRGVRDAVFRATTTAPIGPIAVETGYALLVVDGEDAPESPPDFAAVRPSLEHALRVREERRLADGLARRLLEQAEIDPADPGLAWGWWALAGDGIR